MKTLILGTALLASASITLADDRRHAVEHVLIISIDGMHQQDLARCLTDKTCPNIAALARHGVNYTNAWTPGLSDSVPGLAALVTGGAAVIATKKGFWAAAALFLAKMWKLVAVGGVAAIAGLKSLFKKKESSN